MDEVTRTLARAIGMGEVGHRREGKLPTSVVAAIPHPVLSPSAPVRARPLPRRPPPAVFPTLGRTTGRRRAIG